MDLATSRTGRLAKEDQGSHSRVAQSGVRAKVVVRNHMKKKPILLFLSLAGLVLLGFFLLPGSFTSPTPTIEDPEGSLKSSRITTEKLETRPKPESESTEWWISEPTAHPGQKEYAEADPEEEAKERVEAQQEAREKAEETAGEQENEPTEERALTEAEKDAVNQFLTQMTAENWREVRTVLLSSYKDGTIPRHPFVENMFWSKVGEVGGEKAADELLADSDPAFPKILEGWGKKNPQGLFEYLWNLKINDPKVQKYLAETNNRELPLLDQFSNGIIEGLLHADSSEAINDAHVEQISGIIDRFMENDPQKADSLMREFSSRVVKGQNPEALKEWVSYYEKPNLQAAAVQRVIESGAFDENPADAAEFAWSLEKDQPRRTALSAAYARLANDTKGHDPFVTAAQLNEMNKGADRDFALNGFAHGLVHQDPEAALEWAREISNEGFRKVVVENISRRIKKERPKARQPTE